MADEHFQKMSLEELLANVRDCNAINKRTEARNVLREKSADELLGHVNGNPDMGREDQYEIALILEKKGKYLEALELFKEAAYSNYSKAQYVLAQIGAGERNSEYVAYRHTYSFVGSYKESLEWYKSAAENDCKEAAHDLGVAFLNAEKPVREKNEVEAFKWFRKAAQLGSNPSQYQVAQMLKEGIGTQRNTAEAKKWEETADNNNFRYKIDVEHLHEKLKATPEPNNPKIFLELAEHYLNGKGVSKSPRIATEYLYEAGKIHMSLGEKEKALRCLDLIEKHTPGNALIEKLQNIIYLK